MSTSSIARVLSFAAYLAAAGCTAQQAHSPADKPRPEPRKGDKTMSQGEYRYGDALIDSVDIIHTASGAVELTIAGSFRDGCTELHEVKQTRHGDTLRVRVVTRRPVDMMCTQALVPFTHTATLDTAGLEPGRYRVAVDGVETTLEIPPPE